MSKTKVIISCAVTGAVHTPSMSPHLPVTGEEIAESAIGAAQAGAAIVHLHGRSAKDGRPDQSLETLAPFLKIIKQRSNCVINITTGGATTMTIDERLKSVATFKPELASLNMGSMNFGLYGMLKRNHSFAFDWERPYLEGSKDRIFKNTFADIERILTVCADNGTRFECECYDIGHLYTLAHFVDRGLIKAPFFVQSVFGILGGIGTHPEDVMHMRRTADRLFGSDYCWSAFGAGRYQYPIAVQVIALGGNVRVGLRRLAVAWGGPACEVKRRTSRQGAPARRRVRIRRRNARRRARSADAQRRRPGCFLIDAPEFDCRATHSPALDRLFSAMRCQVFSRSDVGSRKNMTTKARAARSRPARKRIRPAPASG